MTNGNERFERIERFLEQVTVDLQEATGNLKAVTGSLKEVASRQHEMAARQQYHDEAFERHDAEMKSIRDAIAADAENIRALVRIAELHHRRLEGLEGGDTA